MNSISANLNIMIKACEKASKILIRDFGEIEKLQVKKKGPLDFVTNSDLRAEKVIIDELKKAIKLFDIYEPSPGRGNFLHGVPHFAISIGLLSNDEVKSGLIFDPIKNEMFYAEKNNGAFFNNERIRVSKKNELSECLFATGGKKYNSINEISTRKSGCAALDLAYVASGRYDGYCQNNLNLWDIAAGLIILQEAGGVINDIDLNNHKNLNVIASSPNINDKFIKKISNF